MSQAQELQELKELVKQMQAENRRAASTQGRVDLSIGNGWQLWSDKAKAALAYLDSMEGLTPFERVLGELVVFIAESANSAAWNTRRPKRRRYED